MREDMGLYMAKRKDNGKWVQGYLFCIWEKAYILWGTTNGIPNMVEVDPETVCEGTGLVDANGVKIFEGDIVRHYNKIDIGMPNEYDVGEIQWYKKECRFDRTSNNGKGHALIGQHCVYEVIGNIHDKAVEDHQCNN